MLTEDRGKEGEINEWRVSVYFSAVKLVENLKQIELNNRRLTHGGQASRLTRGKSQKDNPVILELFG